MKFRFLFALVVFAGTLAMAQVQSVPDEAPPPDQGPGQSANERLITAVNRGDLRGTKALTLADAALINAVQDGNLRAFEEQCFNGGSLAAVTSEGLSLLALARKLEFSTQDPNEKARYACIGYLLEALTEGSNTSSELLSDVEKGQWERGLALINKGDEGGLIKLLKSAYPLSRFIDYPGAEEGGTFLHIAAQSTNPNALKIVELLLRKGASLTRLDANQKCAGELACNQDVNEYLAERMRCVHRMQPRAWQLLSGQGYRPEDWDLIEAVEAGDFNRVIKLLRLGANIRVRTCSGDTLLEAARVRRKELLGRDVLVVAYRDIGNLLEAMDLELTKRLIKAIRKGDVAQIEKLIAMGADPNGRSKVGQLPLEVAMQLENDTIACMLIEAGARVDVYASSTLGATVDPSARGVDLGDVWTHYGFWKKYSKLDEALKNVKTVPLMSDEDILVRRIQNKVAGSMDYWLKIWDEKGGQSGIDFADKTIEGRTLLHLLCNPIPEKLGLNDWSILANVLFGKGIPFAAHTFGGSTALSLAEATQADLLERKEKFQKERETTEALHRKSMMYYDTLEQHLARSFPHVAAKINKLKLEIKTIDEQLRKCKQLIEFLKECDDGIRGMKATVQRIFAPAKEEDDLMAAVAEVKAVRKALLEAFIRLEQTGYPTVGRQLVSAGSDLSDLDSLRNRFDQFCQRIPRDQWHLVIFCALPSEENQGPEPVYLGVQPAPVDTAVARAPQTVSATVATIQNDEFQQEARRIEFAALKAAFVRSVSK